MDSDSDIGKLRWRCRRGMKELDLLLTRYVDEQYREAAPDHRQAFRRLLDCHDPLIYDYLLGRVSPLMPCSRPSSSELPLSVRTTANGACRGC